MMRFSHIETSVNAVHGGDKCKTSRGDYCENLFHKSEFSSKSSVVMNSSYDLIINIFHDDSDQKKAEKWLQNWVRKSFKYELVFHYWRWMSVPLSPSPPDLVLTGDMLDSIDGQ